ncbi:Ribonuclease H [Citrus sinensis]|uniref:Ribonuclease H n=1 Tax=Citrus sinensis TaxID=2711 RepID=A0ACB8K8T7_CITSI|nr:Ribonuclease H [Citrus sinensis]
MEAGGSSAQGGDMRLNDSVTLREIASEAREKAMFDRMERMEKQMETLTTILHELRSERRVTQEEMVRGGGVTPGPDGTRRSQTTGRFSGERGNIPLWGEFHREEEQSPARQIFYEDDGVANAEETELRQHLHDVEQERDQVAARDPGRAVQLEEEVRRLAQIIDDMQGRSRAPGWRIMLDGESLLAAEIMRAIIPRDFRLPDLRYSGRTDPLVHIERFNDITGVQGLSQPQRCRVFPLSLEGRAREWYRKLPRGSIKTFEQMCQEFAEQFSGAMAPEDDMMELKSMKQGEQETLREFIKRFHRAVLDLGAFNHPQALRGLKERVKIGRLWYNLRSPAIQTYAAAYEQAKRDIEIEEEKAARIKIDQLEGLGRKEKKALPGNGPIRRRDHQASGNGAGGRVIAYQPHQSPPQYQRSRAQPPRSPAREPWRRHDSSYGAHQHSHGSRGSRPEMSLDEVYEAIKDRGLLYLPAPITKLPSMRDRGRYCKFHGTHGHTTADCRDLKTQVEDLVRNRYLDEFVDGTFPMVASTSEGEQSDRNLRREQPAVRVIAEGPTLAGDSNRSRKNYARYAMTSKKVFFNTPAAKRARVRQVPIMWTDEDEEGIIYPHEDALVIKATVASKKFDRILVDTGSSVDVLFKSTLKEMRIADLKLDYTNTSLKGFGGGRLVPLGMVELPITIGSSPTERTMILDFMVVDEEGPYQMILGRPFLRMSKAVLSNHYLALKYRVNGVVGVVRGDQRIARSCYSSAAREAMQITSLDTRVENKNGRQEPVEDLETVSLGPENPGKTIRIGSRLKGEQKQELVKCLQAHADVFAWTHEDMPGIDPEVACHKLAIKKGARAVRQKRRCFNQERYEAINVEVEKLLRAGFIREVNYPEWISNVVLVKKANGKWRMCVDFTDLNKACPKDSFPLPKIDQLVDSTAGHGLLSFMDAFSGYNQIPMYEQDEESTAFITNQGLFCYRVIPFGLKNAGATYQRLVNKVFKPLIGKTMEVYVDDMITKSKISKEHVRHLEETFGLLRKYKMKLNPEKCAFGVESGKFLGFMVSHRGIEANPEKIQAIVQMRSPRNLKEMQSLTGRYPPLEKWALALVVAARKLRPYFQAFPVSVITNQSLRQTVHKPDASGRLVKWAIELSEFDIDYKPRAAIKAQAMADFVAEFTEPEVCLDGPDVVTDSGEAQVWQMYVDGSSGEQGSGAGIVLEGPEGEEISYVVKLEFGATNNQAEYEALIAGLELAKAVKADRVKIRTDSQLVANHVSERFQPREKKMEQYLKIVRQMMGKFEAVEVIQIPREQNSRADTLARMAAVADPKMPKSVPLEVKSSPSIEQNLGVLRIEQKCSCMDPIISYLRDGVLPPDKLRARKVRAQASRYTMIDGVLYRRGYILPFLRCLDEDDADYVLREVHEGICGNHSGGRSLAHKVLRQGYFWPTMHQDAQEKTRSCVSCQSFASFSNQPPEKLTSMASPWPFAQWGIDLIGPLPKGRGAATHAIVAIDYFTKWIEVEALSKITEKKTTDFVWRNLVCRYGIPYALVTDNGRQFDNHSFRDFCQNLGIELKYCSPAHPQSNGQAEAANKTIKRLLKTRLGAKKGAWVDELSGVLWAYRTTHKTATGETPFALAFGHEAVVPTEIGTTTHRTYHFNEQENDEQICLNLDLLTEKREQAAERSVIYQQRVARYYNQKVNIRQFKVGDWVLRRVNQNTKDSTQRVLGPNWEGPYRVKQLVGPGAYKLVRMDGHEVKRPWNAAHLRKYFQSQACQDLLDHVTASRIPKHRKNLQGMQRLVKSQSLFMARQKPSVPGSARPRDGEQNPQASKKSPRHAKARQVSKPVYGETEAKRARICSTT